MINHASAMRLLQQQSERGVAYPDDSYYIFSLTFLLRMQFIYTGLLQLIKTALQTAGSVWRSSICIMLIKTSSHGHAVINSTTISAPVCFKDILFDLNTVVFISQFVNHTVFKKRRKKANSAFHWIFFLFSN